MNTLQRFMAAIGSALVAIGMLIVLYHWFGSYAPTSIANIAAKQMGMVGGMSLFGPGLALIILSRKS